MELEECGDQNEQKEKTASSLSVKDEKPVNGIKTDKKLNGLENPITIPGAIHFAEHRSLSYKILWAFILLVCACVCAWQIGDRIVHYYEYPTIRKIHVYQKESLDFPGITICEPFRYRFDTLSSVERQIFNLSSEILRYLFSYSKTINNLPPIQSKQYLINMLQQISQFYPGKFNFTDFILRVGYQLTDFNMKKCLFDGNPCSVKDFSFSFTSTYEVCWTFNSNRIRDTLLKQQHTGKNGGLKLVIDTERNRFIDPFINDDIGLKLFIHPPYDYPFLEQYGFAFNSGQQAYVSIKYSKNINLPKPYGNCSQEQLHHFLAYTVSSCLIECKIKQVMNYCGCKPPFYPGIPQEFVPECDLLILVLCYNNIQPDPCSHCNIPCIEEFYSATLSYSKLNAFEETSRLAQKYSTDINYLIKNFVFINIYYETSLYVEVKQNAAITASSLISDVGGQIGLFLGISILTVVEIIEHSYKLIKKVKSSDKKK